MKRFIQSTDRTQVTLFPERLEDYVAEDNPVRVVDVFVEQLDLGKLGFDGVIPLKPEGPPITLPYFLNSISTVTRTGFNLAVDWNVKANAIWNSSG